MRHSGTSCFDFKDDFQFHRRSERQARDAKHQSRDELAEHVAQQFRCGIGDWVLGKFRRRRHVDAEPNHPRDAIERGRAARRRP